MSTRRVGILVFPDVEVLDFGGPFDVFSTVRLDEAARFTTKSPFQALLIAEKMDPVVATGGMRVLPEHTLDEDLALDVLVIPGGRGVQTEIKNERLIEWIRTRAPRAETLTSVCTGSFLLARAGLLEGRRATTHFAYLDRMAQEFPRIVLERHLHVVEEDRLLTAAGISAGIDMALRVVALYHGEPIARATARYMEYPYPEDMKRRV